MRKNTRCSADLLTVVEKKRPAVALFRGAAGRIPDYLLCLSQPQTVEQGSANSPVHGQAISAFKSRDGAAGLRSDNSIDYAAVITELGKTPLHSCNH
jgi:hypothetical protein